MTASGTVTYTAGGGAVPADSALAVTDPGSSTLVGATLTLSSGFLAGDTLNFTNQNGITGSYNSGTGVLTLSGIATLANYQSALESITYSSSASDPASGGSDTSRTLSWQVNDGTFTSAVATSAVHILVNTPTPTHTSTATLTRTPTSSPTVTDTVTATATPTFHWVNSWPLNSPFGLACNRAASVVYATLPSQVDIFDSVTNFNTPTNQWISYGSTAFISPQTQAVNPVNGNVYVLDGGSGGAQVVYQFTSTGGLVNHSTTAFNTIQDVETDSAGNAYVVDQGGATLYELNSSMGVVKTWTAAGSTAFSSLFSVALDSSNNIYVCDNGSAPGHNHIWELNAGAGTTVVNTWNTPSGNFIYQMCVNPSGTVYAVDEGVVGLEKYVPGTPTPVIFTGSEGGGTAFSAPDGVCFLPNGDLLVADFSINKLEEYTP